MIHRLKHLLGWHSGVVVSIVVDSQEHWIAYQCCECGDISGLCKPLSWDYREEMKRRPHRKNG